MYVLKYIFHLKVLVLIFKNKDHISQKWCFTISLKSLEQREFSMF